MVEKVHSIRIKSLSIRRLPVETSCDQEVYAILMSLQISMNFNLKKLTKKHPQEDWYSRAIALKEKEIYRIKVSLLKYHKESKLLK